MSDTNKRQSNKEVTVENAKVRVLVSGTGDAVEELDATCEETKVPGLAISRYVKVVDNAFTEMTDAWTITHSPSGKSVGTPPNGFSTRAALDRILVLLANAADWTLPGEVLGSNEVLKEVMGRIQRAAEYADLKKKENEALFVERLGGELNYLALLGKDSTPSV